jgi:NADH-quinone oxidoreductase subunit N
MMDQLLIYIAAAVSLTIAPRFLEKAGAMRAEYPVLIVLSCVGMGIMVSATDLISLYIGLELQSLSAYVLASFVRSDGRSAEAGLKYFVLGALASGMLLFGASLVYGFAGSTSFAAIGLAMDKEVGLGLIFGIVFILSGLAFKISAAPFHMWTPDVYEGAPTPVTAFFASAPKVAAIALLMRVVLEAFGSQVLVWQQIIIAVALMSIIIGAVGAIGQQNLKRLMAYSSINNVGFILIGLATGTEQGIAAILAGRAADTVKIAKADSASVDTSPDRGLVWTAETPQVFRTAIVLKAYRKVAELQRKVTDDSSAVEFVGQDVSLVENPSVNLKLTRPADFVLAEAILKTR